MVNTQHSDKYIHTPAGWVMPVLTRLILKKNNNYKKNQKKTSDRVH